MTTLGHGTRTGAGRTRQVPASGATALPLSLGLLTLSAVTTALVAAYGDGGGVGVLSLLGAGCTGAALCATGRDLAWARGRSGLLDRQGLRTAGDALLAASRRVGYPVTVVVAELERPDSVSLVQVGRTWRATARRGDLVARLDDAFVLLLPGATPVVAEPLLARLRGSVDLPWRAGLALAEPDDDLDALVARATADLARSRPAQPELPRPRRPDRLHFP